MYNLHMLFLTSVSPQSLRVNQLLVNLINWVLFPNGQYTDMFEEITRSSYCGNEELCNLTVARSFANDSSLPINYK